MCKELGLTSQQCQNKYDKLIIAHKQEQNTNSVKVIVQY